TSKLKMIKSKASNYYQEILYWESKYFKAGYIKRRIQNPKLRKKSISHQEEVEDLYGREKEEKLEIKKMTIVNICTALSWEAAQEKKTLNIKTILELEYLSKEISHEYRRNEIKKDENEIYLDNSKAFEINNEKFGKPTEAKKIKSSARTELYFDGPELDNVKTWAFELEGMEILQKKNKIVERIMKQQVKKNETC
ncbi:3866_t:CDS:2, partial [Gigaspora margarita]